MKLDQNCPNNIKRAPKLFVVRGAIWYHLYNFKNVKNTHGGVLLY